MINNDNKPFLISSLIGTRFTSEPMVVVVVMTVVNNQNLKT